MDKLIRIAENLEEVREVVANYKAAYGDEICTEVVVDEGIASYKFMPNDVTGYIMEVDLMTGKSRHCGNGTGCFWTDWE